MDSRGEGLSNLPLLFLGLKSRVFDFEAAFGVVDSLGDCY